MGNPETNWLLWCDTQTHTGADQRSSVSPPPSPAALNYLFIADIISPSLSTQQQLNWKGRSLWMVSIPHAFCTSMWLTLKLNESSGKFRTVRPSGGGWVRDGLGEGWAGWLIRPHQQTGGSSPASSPAWTHGSTKVEGSLSKGHSSRHIPLSPKPHLHSPLMKTTSQVPWARLPWLAACTRPVKLAWERSNYSLFEAELFSVWISGSEHDLHPYRDPLRNCPGSASAVS